MAFIHNNVTLVTNSGSLTHPSFYKAQNNNISATEVKISSADGITGDSFGISVATGNSRVVVGANGSDTKGIDAGAAYIFDLSGTQLIKITAADGVAGDSFGSAVSIGNGKIVVGAPLDDDKGVDSGSKIYVNHGIFKDGTASSGLC